MAGYGKGWTIAYPLMALVFGMGLPQRAAASSPEDVLKSHGLRQAGSLYVLDLETEIQTKTTELRQAARKLKVVQARRKAAGSPEQYQQAINELGQEVKAIQSEIRATSVQMNQIPRYTYGRWAFAYSNQAYSQLLAYRNQMQMQLNQVNASLRELNSQPFDVKSKEKLDAAVRDEQQNCDQVLADLRKLVDSASEKYAALRDDSSVTKALHALAKTAKVKPKLGPSPHYQTTVKLLEKLEREKASRDAGDSLDDSHRPHRGAARARRGSKAEPAKSSSSGKND
jgi:predicted  nucleic acid-binding Zn-ribbon protein